MAHGFRPGASWPIGAAGWELIPDLRREGIRSLTGVIAAMAMPTTPVA